MLCPSSRTGSVIGKGGSIIKQLREETGARIKVADSTPGVDERVVIISAPDVESMDWSPAQEALFRVHGRIIEGDASESGEPADVGVTTTRLLVPASQIGCLIGKGGSIITKMREETGATIRVLPKDQLPGCAAPSDELVLIVGELAVARKALHNISARLRANPPKPVAKKTPLPTLTQNLVGPLGALALGPGGVVQQYIGTPPVLQQRGGVVVAAMPGGEIAYRVLCPEDRVGSLIGKGGNVVRGLREGTGAKIKVGEATPGEEERVVIISGHEEPGAQYSPAQEALFRVCQILATPDRNQPPHAEVTTRLLVQGGQIGCLLGKGGSIISQMRHETRASIRVLAKEQLPGVALEGDELVQIVGDQNTARLALLHVSTRLRANAPKDAPTPAQQGGSQTPTGVAPASAGVGGAGAGSTGGGTGAASPRPAVVKMNLAPEAVGPVIGRGGSNISQVRQISGARVVLREARGGTRTRVLEISGTPEQTKAAQQLLEAFILQGLPAAAAPTPEPAYS